VAPEREGRALAVDCGEVIGPGGRALGARTLLIEGGQIIAVAAPGAGSEAERIGGERTLAVPGFVNAHQHGIPHSQAAAGIPDAPLEPWMVSLMAAPSVDPYGAARFVAAQQRRAGTTTTVHQHYTFASTPEGYDAEVRAFLSGYRDGGIRAVFALDFKDRGEPTHFPEHFLATLPAGLHSGALELTVKLPPLAELKDVVAGIVADVRSGRYGDASLLLGPSGPVWCSDDLMRALVVLGEEHDLGMTSHVLESPYERAFGPSAYGGRGTIPALDALGVLSPRFLLAHGCQISGPDAGLLAERGCTVVSNPGSNLRLHNGVAPISMLLEAGVNVAVGTDSFALGDRDNILDELRLMKALQRVQGAHEVGLTDTALFSILTENGARAVGRPALSRIEPGAAADLVLVDLDALCPAAGTPDPVSAVVGIAQPEDFDAVIAGGRIVSRRGSVADQPQRPAFQWPEAERTELVDALMPHVREYYGAIEI
jgi:5-methylthioadenosine/S-adenosylhomocysteine deaminase